MYQDNYDRSWFINEYFLVKLRFPYPLLLGTCLLKDSRLDFTATDDQRHTALSFHLRLWSPFLV